MRILSGMEILTRRGWLTYGQFRLDDETVGYNLETDCNEWTSINQVHFYDDVPLVRLTNKTWEAFCTPDHRWVSKKYKHVGRAGDNGRVKNEYVVVNEFVAAQAITSRHTLRLAAMADLDDGPAIDEREAELLGWVLGDGSVMRLKSRAKDPNHPCAKHNRISMVLYQAKPRHVEAIDELLSGLIFSRSVFQARKPNGEPGLARVTWRFRNGYSAELLKRSGYDHKSPVPFVLSLNQTQRENFLRGVFGAEGSLQGSTTFKGVDGYKMMKSYAQADGPQQDAITLAIYLSGMRPAISPWKLENNNLRVRNPRPGAFIREAKPYIGGERVKKQDAGLGCSWGVTTGLGSWTMRQGRQVMLTAC